MFRATIFGACVGGALCMATLADEEHTVSCTTVDLRLADSESPAVRACVMSEPISIGNHSNLHITPFAAGGAHSTLVAEGDAQGLFESAENSTPPLGAIKRLVSCLGDVCTSGGAASGGGGHGDHHDHGKHVSTTGARVGKMGDMGGHDGDASEMMWSGICVEDEATATEQHAMGMAMAMSSTPNVSLCLLPEPFSLSGWYPLYLTQEAALLAPGASSSGHYVTATDAHDSSLSKSYFMSMTMSDESMKMGMAGPGGMFHGDFNGTGGPSRVLISCDDWLCTRAGGAQISASSHSHHKRATKSGSHDHHHGDDGQDSDHSSIDTSSPCVRVEISNVTVNLETTSPNATVHGCLLPQPFALGGWYPLYLTEQDAVAASPTNMSHTHSPSSTVGTLHMPMGVTMYHGDWTGSVLSSPPSGGHFMVVSCAEPICVDPGLDDDDEDDDDDDDAADGGGLSDGAVAGIVVGSAAVLAAAAALAYKFGLSSSTNAAKSVPASQPAKANDVLPPSTLPDL